MSSLGIDTVWILIWGSPHEGGFYTLVHIPPPPPPPSPQCPSCNPRPDPRVGEVEVAFSEVETTPGGKNACLQPPPPFEGIAVQGSRRVCEWWLGGTLALPSSLLVSPRGATLAPPPPRPSMRTHRRSRRTRHHTPPHPLPVQGSGAQACFGLASGLALPLLTFSGAGGQGLQGCPLWSRIQSFLFCRPLQVSPDLWVALPGTAAAPEQYRHERNNWSWVTTRQVPRLTSRSKWVGETDYMESRVPGKMSKMKWHSLNDMNICTANVQTGHSVCQSRK